MKIKTLLIDDEPLALKVLESYIAKLDNIEIVGSFTNSVQAFSFLQHHKVDLLFLDIQMPALSGMDLLKTLSNPPTVIITTAFREYAVESFEFDVIDYLLKPISFERFLKAIQKYFKTKNLNSTISTQSQETTENSDCIFVKENKKRVRLVLNHILYIESLKDYVRFHTYEKKIVSKMSLSELEDILPNDRFIRVHRSYIVPFDKIKAYSANYLDLENSKIPIGNTYKHMVIKRLEFVLK